MAFQIQANDENGAARQGLHLESIPDECPLCHHKVTPALLSAHFRSNEAQRGRVEVLYRCPHSKCHELFIGYYTPEPHNPSIFDLVETAPANYTSRQFSEIIKDVSSDFSKIYNQAARAESTGLDQICGAGFRKSLEFLVKDFLQSKVIDDVEKEKIKKEPLGTCITTRIESGNLKEVAKRAVWLGNDEVHYTRKWGQKDLQDLKDLIDLTIHWMEAEALTEKLKRDMPDSTLTIPSE